MSKFRNHLAGYVEKRFNLKNPPQWFIEYFGGGTSSSGLEVGHQKALEFTPFWAAVRIISGTIASLPFKIYLRLDGGGKQPVSNHPAYDLLHNRPNDYVDAVTFLESRMAHVLCYGNGYAEIQRDGMGRPVALWPLLPNRTARKITEEGKFVYEVTLPAGGNVILPDENVLHVKGLGFDGYTGYDVVRYHREALGLGIGVKEYGARFFANGAAPGGVIEVPTAMSDKSYTRLKESWNELHQGLENAHRVAMLEEGAKWHEYGIDPQKAQALEVQKWSVDDCSRIFQIPPHMLGSMEFSKYNNVEELRIDFLTMTMLYWFRKWEQECSYKLLMPGERRTTFCEFVADGLLRGNVQARTQYYMAGRQWGWLCVDDIREKENMNPLPDGKGKIYLEPLNMKPAGSPDPKAGGKGSPVDPTDPGEDPVRSAHRELLASQWRRIITKQINALTRGIRADFWPAHQEYAIKLLGPSVGAYASVAGRAKLEAGGVLDDFILAAISPAVPLGIEDADRLADQLMQEIGSNHHAAAKA